MFLYRQPAKMLYKSKETSEVLQKLSEYVDSHIEWPLTILVRLWEDQQDALTYREIREAILAGDISEEMMQDWIQDYSRMAAERFMPVWLQAAEAAGKGQPVTRSLPGFAFRSREKGVRRWVIDHSGEFITAVSEEQRQALRAMIGRAVDGKYTVDELSRVIRPCIGLNRPQAEANLRYYETVRDNLLEQHPKMRVESAQKQAREMAAKYAERQHRQRAYMIAETELVTAYNGGNELAVRQAQRQGKLGAVKRIGSTADDERVCRRCSLKHGRELSEEDGIPPWHPRCRCAIAYEPTGEAVEPQSVAEPEFIPVDETVTNELYEQIQAEFSLLPSEHQDILDRELVGIRKSLTGNSRANKLTGCIEVADELAEGEFIHEAAHILEDHYGVYKDRQFIQILQNSLEEGIYFRDTKTFVRPINRVSSPMLVSDYQGRAYTEYGIPLYSDDGGYNPNAFADFFAEGYRVYVTDPGLLKSKNPGLWEYMEGLR